MKARKYFIIVLILYLPVFVTGQKTIKQTDNKITISGLVIGKDKKPVEGALFYVDDVKTGTKSKKDGSYRIKVNQNAGKILVKSSLAGSCEKEINSQTNIEFILNGIVENKSLGGDSIRKPARSKPKKINTYTDIYQMIRAEVSGVVVNGRSVLIQQGHSFFGSSEPLFVVNGVIVGSIDYVNPLEVKSINVLKGSSAAIYGVRGSNGVISITLKNGSEKEK
jgi:TonB-dependent SusC/RagA subfamily outer membrane receptor